MARVAKKEMIPVSLSSLPIRVTVAHAAILILVLLVVSGCALFHPYPWYGSPASPEDQRRCRAHCASIETDRHAGTCWLACASALDPYYIRERSLRAMSDGELLAHGFCRPTHSDGSPFVQSGEVLLHPVDPVLLCGGSPPSVRIGLRYRVQGTAMFPVPAWIGSPCATVSACPPVPGLRVYCFVPVTETERACVYER